MTDEHPSFQQLLPTFLIPQGTQVVLTADYPRNSEREETVYKAGTVGVVVLTPTDNSQPYSVQLSSGIELAVMFGHLSIRRREIEDALGEIENVREEFRPFIIFACVVGSRAFGLSHGNSDEDIRGIFLPPARWHWSLRKVPEQIELLQKPSDEVYWELEKFVRLALKANPNVLEVLWSPLVTVCTEIGQQLLDIRHAFLSRHIFKTYSGYVLSQFRRMQNAHEKTDTYKGKHAMHLIRLLHSGIAALQTWDIRVDVSDHRDELLEIKTGELPFETVKEKALSLDEKFRAAVETTTLPEHPDFETVDQFLIQARRSRCAEE